MTKHSLPAPPWSAATDLARPAIAHYWRRLREPLDRRERRLIYLRVRSYMAIARPPVGFAERLVLSGAIIPPDEAVRPRRRPLYRRLFALLH